IVNARAKRTFTRSRVQEKSRRALCPASRGTRPRLDRLAPRRRPAQRERERERRVSDADASYNRPSCDARTLKHVYPQRKHAKNNSLSEVTRPLSQGPRQNCVGVDHEDRPKTRPMFARHPSWMSCQWVIVHESCTLVNPGGPKETTTGQTISFSNDASAEERILLGGACRSRHGALFQQLHRLLPAVPHGEQHLLGVLPQPRPRQTIVLAGGPVELDGNPELAHAVGDSGLVERHNHLALAHQVR